MNARKYTASDRLRTDFVAMPNSIIRSERLTGNAKALYAIMVDASWRGAEPEQEELGRLLGGGKKAAVAALKLLADVGLIEVRRRGRGMTNAYTILHPTEVKKGREGTSRSAVRAQPEAPSGPNPARAQVESELQLQDKEANASAPEPYAPTPFDHLARVCGIKAEHVLKGGPDYDKDLARETAVALASIRRKSKADSDEQLSVEIQLRATLYVRKWPAIEITPSALAKHWNRIATTQLGQQGQPELPCPHCPPAAKMRFSTERKLAEHIHVQHPEQEEANAA